MKIKTGLCDHASRVCGAAIPVSVIGVGSGRGGGALFNQLSKKIEFFMGRYKVVLVQPLFDNGFIAQAYRTHRWSRPLFLLGHKPSGSIVFVIRFIPLGVDLFEQMEGVVLVFLIPVVN